MQAPAYTKKFAISQSAIKDWVKMDPIDWYMTWITKELKRPETETTDLGSLLHVMMYQPKKVDKLFIEATCPMPSDTIKKIVFDIFNHIKELNANAKKLNDDSGGVVALTKELKLDDEQLIKKFALENDYYAKKPDMAYNKIVDEKNNGPAYFEFLKTTNGKKVITPKDKALATELKEILETNKVSKGFFLPKKDCEVIFETHIFADFEISGLENVEVIPMKGAIDTVHFNHKRKEVREVDLKYTNNAFMFGIVVKQFDYPMQHSVYDFLLREWLKTYKGGIYKDYAVMPPMNVVIDPDKKTPYLYCYNFDDLYIKRKGIEGTWIKGWEDIVYEIAWHIDKGQWQYPKEHIMNNYISIKIFSKK